MSRQELAEAVQRLDIILLQTIEQRAQLPVVLPSALLKLPVFRAMQERQQRLLLKLKVRFQFGGKGLDHALAGLGYPFFIARLCRPLAGFCQGKGGVMFPRQWLQGWSSFHGMLKRVLRQRLPGHFHDPAGCCAPVPAITA